MDAGLAGQLGAYGEFVSVVSSVDSLTTFIASALFQYQYIYLACAFLYLSDFLIKAIQAGRSRRELVAKSPRYVSYWCLQHCVGADQLFASSLLLRLGAGILLIAVQSIYLVYQDLPS